MHADPEIQSSQKWKMPVHLGMSVRGYRVLHDDFKTNGWPLSCPGRNLSVGRCQSILVTPSNCVCMYVCVCARACMHVCVCVFNSPNNSEDLCCSSPLSTPLWKPLLTALPSQALCLCFPLTFGHFSTWLPSILSSCCVVIQSAFSSQSFAYLTILGN